MANKFTTGLITGWGGIWGLTLFHCGMKAIERLFAQGLHSTVSDQTLLRSQEPSSAPLINPYKTKRMPITVAARPKAWIVLARSNTGIMIRIPLEAWLSTCVYSVFVLSCVEVAALRRADRPSKESHRLCKRLINWKSGQGPTELYSHRWMNETRWIEDYNNYKNSITTLLVGQAIIPSNGRIIGE
jgi:hypothetical protein